jgi:sugar O-acyltransferase (sialic acid O-acetyltransferase NeuD family)
MTRPLIILGTGGSAHDLLDIVEAINAVTPTWHVTGFLDDSRPVGSRCLGFEVLGSIHDAMNFKESFFINVIGSDRSYKRRPEIIASTGLQRDRFASLVHPKACVSSRARLGHGVYASFGASIGGGVIVGDHVSLCPGVIVGHDARIDDFALIAPGAVISGHVQVGRNSYIGARSVIRQQVHIGKQALVGMGAAVLKDVEAESKVVGIPARALVRSIDLPRLVAKN